MGNQKSSARFRDYLRAFGARWFVAMSGPLTVPATIAAALVENTVGKVALILTAVACFVFSSYWVWKIQKERADTFEDQLKPRIKLDFSPSDIACVHQIASEPRKIFRVRLTNIGGKPLYCSGYLNRVVYKGGNPGLTSPLPLTIAPSEDGKDALRRLIVPKIEHFLDIGLVGEVSPNRFFPATEMAFGQRAYRTVELNLFSKPGSYELEIAVAPDDGPVETINLLLNLTDDWRTTEITSPPKS